MSMRWTNTLLLIMCTGSLMASGMLTLYLERLSSQIDQLNLLVEESQLSNPSIEAYTTQPSLSNNVQNDYVSLKQEIILLRKMLHVNQSKIISEKKSGDFEQTDDISEHIKEQQISLVGVVDEAIGKGYWSNEDALAFQVQSVGMPPIAVQEMAAKVIRGLENGTLQKDDDLLMPF